MPWWQRKPRDTRIVATGNGEPWLTMVACTLFHSYLRLHARVETVPRFGEGAVSPAAEVAAKIHFDGNAPRQQSKCRRLDDGRAYDIELEALVDPVGFPGNGVLEITLGNQVSISPLVRVAGIAVFREFRSLFEPLKAEIAAWIAAHATARPAMLDIGGRARSGHQLSERFPECDVCTFDIVPDPGVQVVGDAHDLGKNFAPASFDFVHCASVFEHLVMPWKVALEINRVLKPGGVAYIFTHQTTGLHDMPWDFFRFSDAAWAGLFNRFTGFEVVQSEMSNTMHIVPRAWSEHYRGNENAGGFESSSVIVRKIGEAAVTWEVPVPEILQTSYPTGTDSGA